jgi:flagellar biosynthesis GTPase FlhF
MEENEFGKSMQLKSYFSGTVEAAMELARKELGEEALLVNARPATPETRYLGAYEVVFGVLNGTRVPQASETRKPSAMPDASAERPQPAGSLALEFAELKREFERMAQKLDPKGSASPLTTPPGSTAPSPALYARLIERDLDPALARAVVEGAAIETLFETDSTLGISGAARSVVAFVGPPGAGKTVSMVKIAARYGLDARKPVRILSADVNRIAAADQLRSLSSILGIGCDIAETPGALAQMIEEHRSKALVLIDTPGLSRAEMEDGVELARLVQWHPEIDTHLVLPASMRRSDMNRAIRQYLPFGPKKLLFTRIDETRDVGALVATANRWSLPISFWGTGQQIPDDIEPASREALAKLILGAGAPAETEDAERPLDSQIESPLRPPLRSPLRPPLRRGVAA